VVTAVMVYPPRDGRLVSGVSRMNGVVSWKACMACIARFISLDGIPMREYSIEIVRRLRLVVYLVRADKSPYTLPIGRCPDTSAA
jgi:hypothetical protein